MYLNLEEIDTLCELLAAQFPDLVTLQTLPEPSVENRPIRMLRIKAGSEKRRLGLYIQANIHAREWGTSDIVMHFVEQLLKAMHDGTDLVLQNATFSHASIRQALERVELFVVPCLNPDGRAFSMMPGDTPGEFPNHMWRKNRRQNGGGSRGVDLNRNCDWIWNFRTAIHPAAWGTSGNHCRGVVYADDYVWSDTYHGPSAFSEPEARNVRAVLDAHPHIRAFVDVHGFLGKIMTPWADDEIQTSDPEQSFGNTAYDGLRGLRDQALPNPDCANVVQFPSYDLHPDGASYREFMHRVDQKRYGQFATLQHDAAHGVRGTRYATGPSFDEMYGMSGNMHDYAYSRHLADPTLGKVDGFIYEYEKMPDHDFQPPFENPPGPQDMIHIIRDLSAALAGLLLNVDRMPIVACVPPALDFGRVRVGTTATRSLRFHNGGVRPVGIVSVAPIGSAGPFAVGAPSITALAAGFSAGIDVIVAPTATGSVTARIAIEFEHANDDVRDVRIVPCTVVGCTAPANACVAPVFPPANSLVCFSRLIVYSVLIIALAFIALFSSKARCTIRQLAFRIRHCSGGNTDGCREL